MHIHNLSSSSLQLFPLENTEQCFVKSTKLIDINKLFKKRTCKNIHLFITGSHGNSHRSNQQTQEQMEAPAFGHSGKKINSYAFI